MLTVMIPTVCRSITRRQARVGLVKSPLACERRTSADVGRVVRARIYSKLMQSLGGGTLDGCGLTLIHSKLRIIRLRLRSIPATKTAAPRSLFSRDASISAESHCRTAPCGSHPDGVRTLC